MVQDAVILRQRPEDDNYYAQFFLEYRDRIYWIINRADLKALILYEFDRNSGLIAMTSGHVMDLEYQRCLVGDINYEDFLANPAVTLSLLTIGGLDV